MNGPERLAEAKRRIADIKSTINAGRADPSRASIIWFEVAFETCDFIEWLMDEIEKDADDQGV